MADEADPWLAKLRPAPSAGSSRSGAADPWSERLSPPDEKAPTFLGALARGAMTGMGVFPSVAVAAAGKNEFDFPEIGTIGSGASFDERTKLGLDFARGEQDAIEVLKKRDPNLQIAKDKYDNIVVNFEGRPYYVNRSGISERDVRDFTRDMLIQLPLAAGASWLTGGAAFPLRAAAQMVAGGTGSIATDVASRAAGGDQPLDLQAALASALGGGAGEMLGSAALSLTRMFTQRPAAYVDMATGRLTPHGIRVVTEAGFDPNVVGGRLAEEFASRVRAQGPGAAMRNAQAAEFGIELTPGLASGNIDRQALEQAANAGARGDPAAAFVRPAMDRMNQSVRQSADTVSNRVAPMAARAGLDSPADNAAFVQQGVRDAYDVDRAHASALWDAARDYAKGVRIPMREVRRLPDVVRSILRGGDEPLRIDPKLHEVSSAAMRLIDEFGDGTLEDLSTRSGNAVAGNLGVGLDAVDKHLRRGLSQFSGEAVTPGDRLIMRRIVRGYEAWLDGIEDGALMANLPDAVAKVREARQSSAQLFNKYGERMSHVRSGTTDRAGQTLERMIHDDVTADEVGNWLWGKISGAGKADAYRLIQRVNEIIPDGTPERDAIKRGVLQATLTAPEGKTQPGPEKMAQNLFELINGKGREFSREVFSADDIAMLRRYGAALRSAVPDPRAINPAKSGYEVARAIIQTFGVVGAPIRLFTNIVSDAPRIAGAALTNPARARNIAPLGAVSGTAAVLASEGVRNERQ